MQFSALLLLLLSCSAAATSIELKNGQFRKILVVIKASDELLQQPQQFINLIEKVKTSFQVASQFLENATSKVGRKLGFGHVSFLISGRAAAILRNQSFPVTSRQWQRSDAADFLLTDKIDEKLEGVSRLEPKCGKMADRILLGLQSFHDLHRIHRKISVYFAQFRWGIFDEKPINSVIQDVKIHRFSNDTKLVKASCSTKLKVHPYIRDSEQMCSYNASTKQTDELCELRIEENVPVGQASLLFAPFHPAVTKFCTARNHNRLVKNLHNTICDGQSAAEVMLKHQDFKTDDQLSHPSALEFDFVTQPLKRRVVVLMDVSGSMSTESRVEKLKSAVTYFINNVIEKDCELALMSFTNSQKILQNFVKMESDSIRDKLTEIVRHITASGGTCIGGAVLMAVKMLRDAGDAEGSSSQIILLSDGKDGCLSQLNQSVQVIANSNIEVITVRYGDQASQLMVQLSEVSGGRNFFVSSSDDSLVEFLLSLKASVEEVKDDVNQASITAVLEPVSANFQTKNYLVDEDIMNGLKFVFEFATQPGIVSSMQVVAVAPNGMRFGYENNTSIYHVKSATGTLEIRIPSNLAQPGNWTLINFGPKRTKRQVSSDAFGTISLIGKAAPDTKVAPVVLTADVRPEILKNLTPKTEAAIYGILKKGFEPVIGAIVRAVVKSNAGEVAQIQLMDDGAGADFEKNDGSYSGFVPIAALSQSRDYSVTVWSEAPVRRVKSAGRISVQSVASRFTPADVQPHQITDLSLQLNIDANIAMLTWTPVMDPVTQGWVKNYSIKHTAGMNATSGFQDLPELLMYESDQTQQQQQVNVYSAAEQLNTFIEVAVAAVSLAGVMSEPSKFVMVNVQPVTKQALMEFNVEVKLDKPVKQQPSQQPLPPAVMICVAVAAVVVLAAAAVAGAIFCRRNQQQRRQSLEDAAGDPDAPGRLLVTA